MSEQKIEAALPLKTYSAVPKAVFNTDLDTVATNFLKRPDLPDSPEFRQQYAMSLLSAAEAIVIAPRVTFKVTGENVVLAILTKIFGVKGVRELLEADAIEFVLWRSLVTGVQSEELLASGILPIAPGNSTNPEHADPNISALMGMNWNDKLDRRQKRDVARMAARHTVVTPLQAPSQATEAVMRAFNSGRLRDMGLDPQVAAHNQSADNRNQLVRLATDLTESAVLMEHEWGLYEADSTWASMMKIAAEVRSGSKVLKTAEEIIRLDPAPAIRDLFFDQTLSPSDLLRLRNRPEVRDFREWLWTRCDPADSREIVEAYASLVVKGSRTRLADREWFRMMRTVGVAFAGGVAGNAVAGPIGAGIGAFVASNLASAAVSYGDLLIDRISSGRSPRRFAALLRDQRIISTTQRGHSPQSP